MVKPESPTGFTEGENGGAMFFPDKMSRSRHFIRDANLPLKWPANSELGAREEMVSVWMVSVIAKATLGGV
jgi:hypothetical protein